jgi:hypothetical protein
LVPGSLNWGSEQDYKEESDEAREGAAMFAQHYGKFVDVTANALRLAVEEDGLRVSESRVGPIVLDMTEGESGAEGRPRM